MKAASDGVMPTEQDWENLFALDGYKTAFSKRKDAQEWHDNIKNAFLIQFDANRKAELDSIVKKVTMFASDFIIGRSTGAVCPLAAELPPR